MKKEICPECGDLTSDFGKYADSFLCHNGHTFVINNLDTDKDVISSRYAKELIAEAFIDGVQMAVSYLRKRGDSCNCADALDAIRTELKI